ncbi:MAG: hypothetical protein WAW02_09595 [Sideroxyarcus sp.]
MNEHYNKTASVKSNSDAKTVCRELLLYGAFPLVCAIAIALALGGCASGHHEHSSGADKALPVNEAPAQGAESMLGIRMEGLRLSSAGYILDFRYRVTDPARAAALMDRKIRPYLLDEASGAQLAVPDTAKLGQLRTSGRNKVVTNQDYFILFANPGRYVQAGNKVTLVMGDLRIEHLTVE